MKIITYTVKQTITGLIRKDYKEITNIKNIMFIGIIDENKMLISYRYKDKKYNLFQSEQLEVPITYHLEIVEE